MARHLFFIMIVWICDVVLESDTECKLTCKCRLKCNNKLSDIENIWNYIHASETMLGVSIGRNIFQKGLFWVTLGGISKFYMFLTQNYLYVCPDWKSSKARTLTFLVHFPALNIKIQTIRGEGGPAILYSKMKS